MGTDAEGLLNPVAPLDPKPLDTGARGNDEVGTDAEGLLNSFAPLDPKPLDTGA